MGGRRVRRVLHRPLRLREPAHSHIIYGALESLVDDDFDYVRMDAPITLVSKITVEISELTYIANFDLVDAMTDVGDWPKD